MRHGSFFSGIGGFDYAAQVMGWKNIFHCEINKFGQHVLKHYWPNAKSHEDITKTDFTIYRGKIDIVTGGFPCQPYSVAGKRKGTDDERHLWPEMLRAICEISPTWIVGENVLGIVSWNGGMVFEEVQSDLEAAGYEVQAYVLPAASVAAPHKRDRVWFVAHKRDDPNARIVRQYAGRAEQSLSGRSADGEEGPASDGANTGLEGLRKSEIGSDQFGTAANAPCFCERKSPNEIDAFANVRGPWVEPCSACRGRLASNTDLIHGRTGTGGIDGQEIDNCSSGNVAHACGAGCEEFNAAAQPGGQGFSAGRAPINWTQWPTQSPVCDGNDGLPARLDATALFACDAKPKKRKGKRNHYTMWRNESIKAGGNAVVPQVVLQIFKAIEQYEKLH